MKRIICGSFIIIIFIPAILHILSFGWKLNFDVKLGGYTDTTVKPDLTWENFESGEFQREYTSWFEAAMKPRGIITKTYSTIRYNVFHLGNRIIGNNNDIFEDNYIDAEYALKPEYDMAQENSRLKMDEYITILEDVCEKLANFNKTLYIYIGANKAEFDSENVPQKYKDLQPQGFINIVDYMRTELDQTIVPYKICSDLKDELDYPAYYPTGIHWSRTFEQKVSSLIVTELSNITGKKYRNLILGNIRESDTPFWRDADVFNLLNVWNTVDCTYYEYEMKADNVESYDKMRFLIAGDSFVMGLRNDILETYPDEDIYIIAYDQYIQGPDNTMFEVHQNWENLDMQYYLDNTDVIILGYTEPNLTVYSYGFVQYLNNYLDTYQPKIIESNSNMGGKN